jgi:hypothetical protein
MYICNGYMKKAHKIKKTYNLILKRHMLLPSIHSLISIDVALDGRLGAHKIKETYNLILKRHMLLP